jgi:hypothetical protein
LVNSSATCKVQFTYSPRSKIPKYIGYYIEVHRSNASKLKQTKLQTMKGWSLPTAAAVVAATIFFSLSTMALPAASAIVEHTFVVSLLDPLFHGLDDLHCTSSPS